MSFAQLGISGRITTKDGQKFFDVTNVKIDSILNLPITVVDFETNIKTSHGTGRYAVKILYNGEERKFITNSFTLKNMLDQVRAMNALPVDTIIKKKEIGGKFPDYYFE